MYSYLKLVTTLPKARNRPKLELGDIGILYSRAGIADVDAFLELNHSRQILYMEPVRWDYSRGLALST